VSDAFVIAVLFQQIIAPKKGKYYGKKKATHQYHDHSWNEAAVRYSD
jgi:hypothetical protein